MYKKTLYVKKDGSEVILLWVGKKENYKISRVSTKDNEELDSCDWAYIPALDNILATIGQYGDRSGDYTYMG